MNTCNRPNYDPDEPSVWAHVATIVIAVTTLYLSLWFLG